MKLYHASPEDLVALGCTRAMMTFANWSHDNKASKKKVFKELVEGRHPQVEMFLDSGAHSFGAGTLEVQESYLGSYIAFLREHGHKFVQYVQLDTVGDGAKTRANLEYMLGEGLRPLPVYTADAPIEDLAWLCERFDYIGLGGLRGRTMGVDSPWRKEKLDSVFRVAEKHWPVKFHAFGIVSQSTLERYPFYSSDSASAVLAGGYGWVLTERAGCVEQLDSMEVARETMDTAIASLPRMAGSNDVYLERAKRSMEALQWLEQYVTRLWAQKGVVWDG